MAQVANLAAQARDVPFVPDGARRNANGGRIDNNGFCKSVRLFLVDVDCVATGTDAATSKYKWDSGPSHGVAIM